jgi:hypothetical protein
MEGAQDRVGPRRSLERRLVSNSNFGMNEMNEQFLLVDCSNFLYSFLYESFPRRNRS